MKSANAQSGWTVERVPSDYVWIVVVLIIWVLIILFSPFVMTANVVRRRVSPHQDGP
jgi:hypothetical protein